MVCTVKCLIFILLDVHLLRKYNCCAQLDDTQSITDKDA